MVVFCICVLLKQNQISPNNPNSFWQKIESEEEEERESEEQKAEEKDEETKPLNSSAAPPPPVNETKEVGHLFFRFYPFMCVSMVPISN